MKIIVSLFFVILITGCSSPLKNTERDDMPVTLERDPRWAGNEQYIHKVIKNIQKQWDRIVSESKTYPPKGTQVTVVFRMEAEQGSVSEIIRVDSHGNKAAADMCISAITAKSPFGAWTPEMKKALGDSAEVTFTFNYE